MNWDKHFSDKSEVKWPVNDAPVEAVIKVVTYNLRAKYGNDWSRLEFLDLGCGGGVTMQWLAHRGMTVSGIDISEEAIGIAGCRAVHGGYADHVNKLGVGSATKLPFAKNALDGIVEACVIQHLNKKDRLKAFQEIDRVIKPGGVFVGYMLNVFDDTIRQGKRTDGPDTVIFSTGPSGHLQNIGLPHFFAKDEIKEYLPNFTVECLNTTFEMPADECHRRNCDQYTNSFYTVYAVKNA